MFCSICIRIRPHVRFVMQLVHFIGGLFGHCSCNQPPESLTLTHLSKSLEASKSNSFSFHGIVTGWIQLSAALLRHNFTYPFVLVNELRCSNFNWNALKWQLFDVECWRWRRGQWNKMRPPIDLCAACLRLPAHTSIYWVLHLIAYKQ